MAFGKVSKKLYKKSLSRKDPARQRRKKPSTKKSLFMSVSEYKPAFPALYKVCHRYVYNYTILSGAPSGQFVQFRLNSLQDPEYATGGHAPMFYTQMQQIYNNYLVYGVKVNINIVQDNDSNQPMYMMWTARTNDALNTSISASMEQGNRDILSIGYGGSGSKSLSKYIKIKDLYGLKKNLDFSDTNFQALGGANPSAQPIGSVVVVSANETDLVSFSCLITLDYYTMWSSQKEVTQS